jgi:hypothetical protein
VTLLRITADNCTCGEATRSLRDQLGNQLTDLKMPAALEALDDILAGLDGSTLKAPAALEVLFAAQIALYNQHRLDAAMRLSAASSHQVASGLRLLLSAIDHV